MQNVGDTELILMTLRFRASILSWFDDMGFDINIGYDEVFIFHHHACNHMKNLLAIVGDYRTFPQVAESILSQVDKNVETDLFVSVWDVSSSKNAFLGIDFSTQVTYHGIHSIIGSVSDKLGVKFSSVTIRIDAHTGAFGRLRYNSAYVDRFETLAAFIKTSGVYYSKILITRPDLFIESFGNAIMQHANVGEGHMHTELIPDHERASLNDMMFLGGHREIMCLLSLINVASWNNSFNFDWHKWLYSLASASGLKLGAVRDLTLCDVIPLRPGLSTDELTIQEAGQYANTWWVAMIANDIECGKLDEVRNHWKPHMIAKALNLIENKNGSTTV